MPTKFTSLAGVSFPVAGTALTTLTPPLYLYPGWQSGQGQFGTGDPAYVVTNGIVHWTGSLTTTNTSGYYANYFGIGPGSASADRCIDADVYTYGDNVGYLNIWPPSVVYHDRDLWISDTTAGTSWHATLTSLAGISYPQDGTATWQPLNLQNGWATDPPNDYCKYYPSTPSYYVQDHVAYLTGEIFQDHPGGGFITTLPAATRPQHDLYLFIGPDEYLHISPSGNMYAFGAIQPNTISLDTISYQTSS